MRRMALFMALAASAGAQTSKFDGVVIRSDGQLYNGSKRIILRYGIRADREGARGPAYGNMTFKGPSPRARPDGLRQTAGR